jgi:ABC-type uncharacterized transport system permease subunit
MDFFYLRFLLKVLKGKSLMFSLVIALGFIGFSVFSEIRSVFRDVGIAWPIAWIGSIILVTYLAKQEHRLVMHPKFKLYFCLGVVAFGILSSFLLGFYENSLMKDIPSYDLDTSPQAASHNRIGPRGK